MHRALCAVLIAAVSAQAEGAQWVETWGAAPLPPRPALGPLAATPSFSNQTIRQVVRISAGGSRIRVRFTNEYGAQPLAIGAARISLADEKGEVQAGTEKPLTFAGKPGTIIPPGAPMLSDPVDLVTKPLSALSISLYLPESTGPCTWHATGLQTAYVSDAGDFTARPFTPKEKILARAFISGVEVETGVLTKVIVVLGDALVDGEGSTNDANRRWPDRLAERLFARAPRSGWSVVNMGIGGNRLLSGSASGPSALARFDRDVLAVPGLTHVIVFMGVNDLGYSYADFSGPNAEFLRTQIPPNKASSEAMIAGYRQLIARAHARGVKIYGATIAPYEGSFYYSAAGNEAREAINEWIRASAAFDAVLDFDAVLRDPVKPAQMGAGLHSGNHLHGSDAGYEAVAKSIDLAVFK